MRKIYIQGVILFLAILVVEESFSQQFYITAGDSIFTVNANTCNVNFLCKMSNRSTQELACYGNTLYGYTQSDTQLYSIDTLNGTVSEVITYAAGLSNSLVCDQEGNFYEANDDYLIKIPASDPSYIIIGQFFGYTPAGDLAFLNNQLYLSARDYYQSYLLKIDLDPYSTTLIGPMNIGSHWIWGLVTATYMNKLSLLGISDENKLYVIDEVSGNATLICQLPVSQWILGAASKEISTFIPDNQEDITFKIYPTLVTDKLTIEPPKDSKGILVSILTLNGQEILKQTIPDQVTTLDMSNFAGGMYLVRLTTERRIEVKKITIVR